MQFLHGLDYTQYDWRDAIESFWETFPARPGAKQYAEELIDGVCSRREILDKHIASALRNWKPDRVGRVEQNVLRIALYEMAYGNDVPRKVAINEAIEIAKSYGSEEAPRFINGVLDRLKDVELTTMPSPLPSSSRDSECNQE